MSIVSKCLFKKLIFNLCQNKLVSIKFNLCFFKTDELY
jgi:hypothetical protein